MKKTTQFRQLLQSSHCEFLMEAHNGLSARIVEETGFKGIWASGLSISAALGVRDNNEASWTQVLEVCEFMSDASSIPILLDGDTGYGNFNNVRRLIHKLEQRNIAAVCIEDKLFPKTNSFIQGEQQPLADLDEFVGKIKAAKDGQTDPDFSVIARLEAFIAGWGLDEMLRRAEAYAEAGADGLLIHSKLRMPDQILAFAEAWHGPCPLVIVPTTYYSTPVEVFEKAGITLIIWANHNMRACITTMQRTCRQIFSERSLCTVEDQIVPVKEVFRLQNAQELLQAEERYLPQHPDPIRGIILAATQGDALHELTRARPKSMVSVGGIPLLLRMVEQFREEKIKEIVVIRGFGKEHVKAENVTFVDNDDFEETGELYTLHCAREHLQGELIIAYGDIIFRKYILQMLLHVQDDIALVVDADWKDRPSFNGMEDFVHVEKVTAPNGGHTEHVLLEMNPELPVEKREGEWIGLLKTKANGTRAVVDAIQKLKQQEDFPKLQLYHLLSHLAEKGKKIGVYYIVGHWVDVDNLHDLAEAQKHYLS